MMQKKHTIIFILLNIISLFTIFQITFEIIYINPFDINIEALIKINNLLLIFSTGFVLSSLFHIIVNIIPAYKKKKITTEIIRERINEIAFNLEFLIKFTIFRNDIAALEANSSETINIKPIKKSETTEFLFKYANYEFNQEKVLANEFYQKRKTLIIQTCDEILSLPFIDSIDIKYIQLISNIRNSKFLYYLNPSKQEEMELLGKSNQQLIILNKYLNELKTKVTVKSISIQSSK
jgi:hypothetical protein